MSQRPVAIGLLLCEQVIVEEQTRNVTPVNCFSQRYAAEFPSEPIPLVVGEMLLEVVVERLDTLDEIYRLGVPFRFANPLRNVRCRLRIGDCSFPVAGHYQVKLLFDGEMVAHSRLAIIQRGNTDE